MKRDALSNFYDFTLPAIQGTFIILLWVLIILRVRSLQLANRQYPSHWRTASWAFILLSGVLAIVYFVFLVVANVLTGQTWNIAQSKGITEDDLTADDFTPAELNSIADKFQLQIEILFAARAALNFAFWASKAAFILFFFGNRNGLSKGRRWTLYAISTIVFAMFGVSMWATFWGMPVGPLFPGTTLADRNYYIVEGELWRGLAWYWRTPYLEYTLAAMNTAADITQLALACFIIKSMNDSSSGVRVLLVAVGVSLAAGLFHIILYALIEAPVINDGPLGTSDGLQATLVFWMDFEVLLSIIVSCIPGAKAWFRRAWWRRKAAVQANKPRPEESEESESKTLDVDGHDLEFLEN